MSIDQEHQEPMQEIARVRELARAAAGLLASVTKDVGAALAPIRDALGIAPDDPTADDLLRAALPIATEADDDAGALAVLREAIEPPPTLRPAGDFANDPQPQPILWRDTPTDTSEADTADCVLSVGECALLASAGGLGKSTFTLELAHAAAAAQWPPSRDQAPKQSPAEPYRPFAAACGLRVRSGPVVIVSYEDSPARIAHRLQWNLQLGELIPDGIHLAPDPAPLWLAAADRGGQSMAAGWWPALWRDVQAAGARLVIIDPVSAALADVSTSETGPVRAFLRALTAEAVNANCGVLLVAHDTKAARNAVARGDDPGAGAVAGSAAWYDAARGVLTLTRDPASDDRILECIKANYGRTGWGARLSERNTGGHFRGLMLATYLDRGQLASIKRPPKGKGKGSPPAADVGDLSAF